MTSAVRPIRTHVAVLREIALFALFALVAIAYTWPLARDLENLVSDPGDPLLNAWILDWVLHSLTHAPLSLYDAPMFAGAKFPLAFSETLVGIAVLVLPFKLAEFTPLAIHNVAMLLGFTLSAYGTSVLVRTAGASVKASVLAGISFGFGPFFFDHLAHLQVVSAGWLPLMLAGLIRLLRRGTWGSAALFAAAFAMNGLTNVYWLLFGGVTAVATALFAVAVDPSLRDRARLVKVVMAFAAAGLVLLPFLLPYRVVSQTYELERRWIDIAAGSATPIDYFRPAPNNRLHGSFETPYVPERQLATGLVPLLLGLAALFLLPRGERADNLPPAESLEQGIGEPPFRRRLLLRVLDVAAVLLGLLAYFATISGEALEITRGGVVLLRVERASAVFALAILTVIVRWCVRLPDLFARGGATTLGTAIARSRFWPIPALALLWIALAFLGSLGSNSFLYGFFYAFVEPFRAMRVPARWAVIVFVGLAVLAARGADLLLARRRGWQRPALLAVLAFATVADTAPRILWTHVVTDPVPVYEWLGKERARGPIFELPMAGEGIPYSYLLGLARHRVPLVNGTSGFAPPWDERLNVLSARNEFSDEFLHLLHRQGTRLLIVHADLLGGQAQAVVEWIRREVADGRLALVRRFDRGPHGDYVFALTEATDDYLFPGARKSAEWQRLRSTGRDVAGFTDEEKWGRFAAGLSVYSELPILHLESPRFGDEMHRRLAVSGFAFSPHGIRSVEVLIHGARLRFQAPRRASAELSSAHPWYRNDPAPAFELVLPKRPKTIPKQTSVRVRATDRAGRTVESDDRMIVWH